MVVLGGMGSIPGIILGALALIVLPEVFREIELYRMLAFGAAMTLMMLFRPRGLIPAKRAGGRSEAIKTPSSATEAVIHPQAQTAPLPASRAGDGSDRQEA